MTEDIRIIREPKVKLVGRQVVNEDAMREFFSDLGVSWYSDSVMVAEQLIETAGRLCYLSFAKPRPGGNQAYLHHILESGHGSVLEHGIWNFIFYDVSRTLTHELVRHRAGFGFSQLSQRYVDESVAEYVVPDEIAQDEELYAIWMHAVRTSHEAYVKLSKSLYSKTVAKLYPTGIIPKEEQTNLRKSVRESARSVLPGATETKIFVTANTRSIRHFLEQRGSRFAAKEIRKLAVQIYHIMIKEAPNLFDDYTLTEMPDGIHEINTPYRKV
jgi:thymidylate synthase (FAD)